MNLEVEKGYTYVVGRADCAAAVFTIAVTPVIDLELSKYVSDSRSIIGREVEFSIEVVNHGPGTATGVEVEELLPSGYRFYSAYTIPKVLITVLEEFSPNGDGINDIFVIQYLEELYPRFSMGIRNR